MPASGHKETLKYIRLRKASAQAEDLITTAKTTGVHMAVLKIVGDAANSLIQYSDNFETFLNTSRGVSSIFTWTLEMPSHVPAYCLAIGANIAHYAPKTCQVGGHLLVGVSKQVNVLKEHLVFLDLFNRTGKLVNFHKINFIRRLSLSFQITQAVIQTFITADKWEWIALTPFCKELGRLSSREVKKDSFVFAKNICVLSVAACNLIAIGIEFFNKNREKKAIDIRMVGLQDIKNFPEQSLQIFRSSDVMQKREAKRKVPLKDLAEKLRELDDQKSNPEISLKEKGEIQLEIQKLGNKYIRRHFWEEPLEIGDVPQEIKDKIGDLNHISRADRIRRIADYKIKKAEVKLQNNSLEFTKNCIAPVFEVVKTCLVSLDTFGNKQSTFLWISLLAVGAVGLYRTTFLMKNKPIRSTASVWV